MNPYRSIQVVAAVVVLAILGILGNTIFYGIQAAIMSGIVFFRAPIIIIAIGLAIAIVINLKNSTNSIEIGTFAIIFTVVMAIIVSIATSYLSSSAIYKASSVTTENNGESLSFEQRTPFDVAEAVSNRSLGDSTGDVTGVIKSIPAENTFTTAIERRGMFKGYESVQKMSLPLYGAFSFKDNIQFCSFDEHMANRKLNGLYFNNNLYYKAVHTATLNPTARISKGDVIMDCDGDTPMVYLPVTKMKMSGLVSSYRIPIGVVTYNGKTGQLTYDREGKVKDKNIPVYPQSVAKKQRESTKASSGVYNYFFQKAGFESTEGDEEDVNSSNPTEFGLLTTDKKSQYVTPLTPRGDSNSIIALSTVNSTESTYGELNPLTVHRFETPKQATSTIASSIISSELSGYKANGLTVFEVVPSEDGSWTASIGKNQNILYRAIIQNAGDIVLKDKNGRTVSSGNDSEGKNNENGSQPSHVPSVGDKPLEEMSAKELKELADAITGELAKRIELESAPAMDAGAEDNS